MSVKTKTKKPNKLNKTIFDAYEKAINNRITFFQNIKIIRFSLTRCRAGFFLSSWLDTLL